MSDKEHWSQHTYLAVDVEGNGRQPQDLVELAVVRILDGDVRMPPVEWLVRPSESITWHAKRIHGITNRDVRDRPVFHEISDAVQETLGVYPIIGHRVSVDYRVLQSKLPKWKPRAAFDTLKLAKRVTPGLRSYSLSTLIMEFGLSELLDGCPHRAAYDALAAAHLFVTLARKLDTNGNLTFPDLVALSDWKEEDTSHRESQGSLF